MPIALTPNETWKFQLIDDRKEPGSTVWTLRAIPAWVDAEIANKIGFERRSDGTEIVHRNAGDVDRLILEHGVVGWENWRDANGQDVPPPKKGDLSWLDRLAPKHRTELANAIYFRHKLTPEESD